MEDITQLVYQYLTGMRLKTMWFHPHIFYARFEVHGNGKIRKKKRLVFSLPVSSPEEEIVPFFLFKKRPLFLFFLVDSQCKLFVFL